MNSNQEVSLDRRAREESKFVIGVGATLATWGLGLTLVLMNIIAREALGALPIILIPLCAAAMMYAIRSSNIDKREDASQTLLIAFAGILISSQILSAYYFFSLSALIAVLCYFDRKLLIRPAPIGVSALFIVALAPVDPSGVSVFFYCLTTAAVLAYFSKERRDVATSAITILTSLSLAFGARDIDSFEQIIVGLTFTFLSVIFFWRRFILKKIITERRAMLDSVLVLFSISLVFTAIGVVAHKKYLALSLAFGGVSLILRIGPAVWRVLSAYRAGKVLAPKEFRLFEPKFSNAILGTATLSMAIAIASWPLGGDLLGATTIKVLLFLALAALTGATGHFMASTTLRDAGKFYALYAALSSLQVYVNNSLDTATNLIFGVFTVLSYVAVAAVMVLAGRDLHYSNGAAWQSIFSGRALVRLRSARSGAFDILTKVPLIGWVFALVDKTLSRLVDSFGDAKIWTTSHYSICASVFLGFLITIYACSQLIVKRIPGLVETISIGIDPAKADIFAAGISRIFAVLFFSAMLFFVGARIQRGYIRVLAVSVGGLLLAALSFTSIFQDKLSVIVWYYPMAFCCCFAVFRMLWTQRQSAMAGGRDA